MIVQYPDEILRKISEPIAEGDENISDILGNMREQLDRTNGLGIAAVQIGIPKRLIIVRNLQNNSKIVMLNPKIVANSESQIISEEGCLSIGEGKPRCRIKRFETVDIQYQDTAFETHIMKCNGLLSCVAQHEIAHTQGRLIVDELSRLKRTMFLKKLKV